MKNYIDVKVTVWNRLRFSEQANMKYIIELIKENGLDEVIDESIGFVESETLFDTEEHIEPKDNDGEATIEIYENDVEIGSNKHF